MRYRNKVNELVRVVDELTGDHYYTDFNSEYGGWAMYTIGEGDIPVEGDFGFHRRLPTQSFIAYLKGVTTALKIYQK